VEDWFGVEKPALKGDTAIKL